MSFKVILSAVATAFWLSGCATEVTTAPSTLVEGRAGEIRNRPVVSVSTLTHAVRFRDGANEPDPLAISELNDFLVSADASRGAAVLIERSANSHDDDRVAILLGALSRKGLRPTVRVAAVPAGTIRLTIERYVASAPDCPNWSKTPGNDFGNTLPSDFGCATAADLAAMINDPRDLVAGRDASPAAGDAAIAPLQRYRTGRVPPLSADGVGAPSAHAAPAGGPGS